MDENLEFDGEGFRYSIKTYHCYSGILRIKKGIITVKIYNIHKDKVVKEMIFSSKVLDTMSEDQKREYILDCLYVFDKKIDEFNKGNIKL